MNRTRHFVFSTDDYISCFKSNREVFSFYHLYVTISNQTQGDFSFVARDYASKSRVQKRGFRQCNVGILVPEDKIILFEPLNVNLKDCEGTSVAIMDSSTNYNRIRGFDQNYKADKGYNRFFLHSNSAVVGFIVNMRKFSTECMMHFTFSAVSPSEAPQLQHMEIGAMKGLFKYMFLLLFVISCFICWLVHRW